MLNALWAVVGVAATVVLLGLVPPAWRKRGPVFGLRLAAFALLPASFAMMGLFTIVGRLARVFIHLAFSPVAWLGASMLGVSILLVVSAQALRKREVASPDGGARPTSSGSSNKGSSRGATPAIDRGKRGPATDEFSDIEDLLKRRGIS